MSIFKSEQRKLDEQTFETLIKNEQKKLYRIAYTYIKNEQTALDIVQDTIIKAYKSFHKLNDKNLFSTWITRILINTSLDHLKRSIDIIQLDVEWFNPGFNQEDRSIMTLDLASIFEKLRPNQKTLILLRFYYGYSIPEIAEIINKPEGTVKSQLHRTLQVLRKKLANGGDVYGEAST